MLDPSAVRRWCTGAVAALEAARAEIDGLNVYPVPDGDTGTNLLLTLQAADSAVRTDPPGDLAATLGSMARGAVLGARGNSGVILSQVLRGLAESMPAEPDGARAGEGAGPRGASWPGRRWPSRSRGRCCRWSARRPRPPGGAGDSLAAVARAAAGGAARALDRTPDQLPVLARAGVVDAGGRGLCVLLESLAAVVAGEPVPAAEGPRPRPRRREMVRETGSDAYGYEVQYLLDAADAGRPAGRAGRAGRLAGRGRHRRGHLDRARARQRHRRARSRPASGPAARTGSR